MIGDQIKSIFEICLSPSVNRGAKSSRNRFIRKYQISLYLESNQHFILNSNVSVQLSTNMYQHQLSWLNNFRHTICPHLAKITRKCRNLKRLIFDQLIIMRFCKENHRINRYLTIKTLPTFPKCILIIIKRDYNLWQEVAYKILSLDEVSDWKSPPIQRRNQLQLKCLFNFDHSKHQ